MKSKGTPKKNLPNKGEILGGRVSINWDTRLVGRCYSRRFDKLLSLQNDSREGNNFSYNLKKSFFFYFKSPNVDVLCPL